MKVRLLPVVFLACIALVLFSPLLHPGIPNGHDTVSQLGRFAAYFQAFSDGHIPPRWAGNLNMHYGTPVLNFYYPLPGYVASLLHAISLPYEVILKVLTILSLLLAGVFSYLFLCSFFTQRVAILGSLFYVFAPYQLMNIYVRGDIGETMAYMLVPLVLFFLEKQTRSASLKEILYGGMAYGLLVLAHNGVSLLFSPIFFAYIFFRTRNLKTILRCLSMLGYGLLIALFFWVPALLEGKYTNADLFIGDMYKKHFLNPLRLVYAPWGYGTHVNALDGASPQIGIIHFFLTCGGIWVFLKRKKLRGLILFWGAIFALGLLFTTSFSAILWETLPLIKKYEFPWRLIGLSMVAAMPLICIVLEYLKYKQLQLGLVFIMILLALPMLNVSTFMHNSDAYYDTYVGKTYDHGEASTIWTAGDPTSRPISPAQIVEGEAEITALERKTQRHSYSVMAKNNVKMVENTLFYPGWIVTIDGKPTTVEFQDPSHRGLMTFNIPEGRHTVVVEFIETRSRRIANFISLGSLLGGIVLLILLYHPKVRLYVQKNKRIFI